MTTTLRSLLNELVFECRNLFSIMTNGVSLYELSDIYDEGFFAFETGKPVPESIAGSAACLAAWNRGHASAERYAAELRSMAYAQDVADTYAELDVEMISDLRTECQELGLVDSRGALVAV